jgi:predicted DNA-binding transcriptional regulator YafY
MQNDVTTRTITAKSGLILPTTITPQTDMNLMVTAISMYHIWNNRKVAYGTLEQVMEAMRDSSAVVTMYVDGKGEIAARVLWVSSITFTKDRHITCKAYCTLRKEIRSFRLDRILAAHPLTTPDDIAAA